MSCSLALFCGCSNGEGSMHENKLPYSQLGDKTTVPNSNIQYAICLPANGRPAQWSGWVGGRMWQVERIDLLHYRHLGFFGLEQVYGSCKSCVVAWVVLHSTILPSLWRLFAKWVARSSQTHHISVLVNFASVPVRMQTTTFAIDLVLYGKVDVLKPVVAAAKFPKTSSDLGHAVASKRVCPTPATEVTSGSSKAATLPS